MTEQQKTAKKETRVLGICKMCLNAEIVNSERVCIECARELE
nr:hypothetical protein [Brevibacillus laterosporus]